MPTAAPELLQPENMERGMRHKMQLKGKGHQLRAWTHVCGLWAGTDSQLENTECAALLRRAVSLKTSPYCSHQVYATKLTLLSSQYWSPEKSWNSSLSEICWKVGMFFGCCYFSSQSADCRFFNIFAYQIDLTWTTKSRNHSWGCALLLLSSEGKREKSFSMTTV